MNKPEIVLEDTTTLYQRIAREVASGIYEVRHLVNNKIIKTYFVTKDDLNNPKPREFRRATPFFFDLHSSINIGSIEKEDWNRCVTESTDNVRVDELIWIDWASHLVYTPASERPLTPVVSFSYWESRFDLDKLSFHLIIRPQVIRSKRVQVPYYNQEICGNEEIVGHARLTQGECDEVYDRYHKSPHWSARIKDVVNANLIDYDPLEVRQFLKPEQLD